MLALIMGNEKRCAAVNPIKKRRKHNIPLSVLRDIGAIMVEHTGLPIFRRFV
jgi:hypothetical protein